MVSHRAVDDIMQTPKRERQKSCVKRIHLVTDDSIYDPKAFYTVKIVFYSSLSETLQVGI